MRETWKAVAGYKGLYEVSSEGRIKALAHVRSHPRLGPRSYKEKILTPTRQDRYLSVDLWRDGSVKSYRVHRIVAMAFIPNPDALPLVRHLDDVGTNNRKSNLAWGTREDNAADAIKNGAGGGKYRKLTAAQAAAVKAALTLPGRKYGKHAALARKYKVSPDIIRSIASGLTYRRA